MNNSSTVSGKPIVCVTLGDPSGIGPEVVARSLDDASLRKSARWVLAGSEEAFRRSLSMLSISLEYSTFQKLLPINAPLSDINLLDVGAMAPVPQLGKPSIAGGEWAGLAIEAGVDIVLRGLCSALVTAPISKKNLLLSGRNFPGQTEMLASLCGVKRPVMLLADGDLKVALFTRHIALHSLFMYLKVSALAETISVLASELNRWFGIRKPKIAVLGVNPHCGEDGLFGTEEGKFIVPAIEKARKRNIAAIGPVPADTAFSGMERGKYDCIFAIYHDQGLAPFKALSFDKGVNITLNLPFLRTSPDHGTAFDIAPSFEANPESMMQAMRLAVTASQGG